MPEKLLWFDLRFGVTSYGIALSMLSTVDIVLNAVQLVKEPKDELVVDRKLDIGANTLHLLVAGLMIFGALARKKHLLLPYLVVHCICLGLMSIFCTIYMFYRPDLLIYVPGLAIGWYLWVCVLSFYESLDQAQLYLSPQIVVQTSEDFPEKPPPYSTFAKTMTP